MTDHSRPLVHIGMAKAASTFLQLEVFPHLSAVHNMGKHLVAPDVKRALMSLTRLTSVDWARLEPEVTHLLRTEMERARELDRRPALSEEDLSVYKFLDPEMIARRLHGILGDFDVLLIVRNPFTWLSSNYLFRLEHQNKQAVLGFNSWLEHHLSTQRIGSDVGEIWFGELARVYANLCGGAVHIVPFELVRAESSRFAAELARILGGSEAEISGYLNTPKNRMSHKIRVTETQRRLYETFRWIDLQQPDLFVAEVRAVMAQARCAIQTDVDASLDRGIKERWDRAAWASHLRYIASLLPTDEAAARPVMPDPITQKVRHLTHRALRQVKEDFGFDLNTFGLSYDR